MDFPPPPPIGGSTSEALRSAILKPPVVGQLRFFVTTPTEVPKKSRSLLTSFTTNAQLNRESQNLFSSKSPGTIHLAPITDKASMLSNPGKIRRSRVPSFFVEKRSPRSPSTASPSSLGSESDDF